MCFVCSSADNAIHFSPSRLSKSRLLLEPSPDELVHNYIHTTLHDPVDRSKKHFGSID